MLSRREFGQNRMANREVPAHAKSDQHPQRAQLRRRAHVELRKRGRRDNQKAQQEDFLAAHAIR